MKQTITPALALFFIFFHIPSAKAANFDTSFSFSTIQTAHFEIHYHQGLERIAAKAGRIAEEAYDTLTPVFNWTPKEKTRLVLIDDTDFVNGFATTLPYNLIYIFCAPPPRNNALGEYDDWIRMIIFHEFSHILALDPANGYSKFTRMLFGKPLPTNNLFSMISFLFTAPPNSLLPGWWHEGVSSWAESRFSDAGRGKSVFYDMIFRMAVLEDNMPTIDQINGEIPYWPSGASPYIFGMALHKYIIDTYGEDVVSKLSLKHAGRLPYFINGAPLQLFNGKTYKRLYNEMRLEMTEKQLMRVQSLKSEPFTEVTRFKLSGEKQTNPRWAPDGSKIAFINRDPHQHATINTINPDGSDEKELIRILPSESSLSWSKDGASVFFSQAEIVNGFSLLQDLYRYDISEDTLVRLTKGLRIKDPDLSPDGRQIAAITTGRGGQQLIILDIRGLDTPLEGVSQRIRILSDDVMSSAGDMSMINLSAPRWAPDGKSIVYALKDNAGVSALYRYQMDESKSAPLLSGRVDIKNPAFTPDGRFIIYTSGQTGVFNLFAYEIKTSKNYQLTHLPGGAFQADVSKNGRSIVYSSYHSRGFELVTLDIDKTGWRDSPGPTLENAWTKSPEEKESRPNIANIKENTISGEAQTYSPVSTLIPKFWSPIYFQDHKGEVFGAFTAASDALGYHTYSLELDQGARSDELYYKTTYINNQFYPTLIASAYSQALRYSPHFDTEDYYEREKALSFAMNAPILYVESHHRFMIGFELQEKEEMIDQASARFSRRNLFQGARNALFAGYEYSNALKYPYSISPEEGRSLNLLYKNFNSALGSDIHSEEVHAIYNEYAGLPYLQNHVFHLNVKGAFSSGDRIGQEAFQIGGYDSVNPFRVRGYPSRISFGNRIATTTIEYRLPVAHIFRARSTKPFFFEKIHAALFAEAGATWIDNNPIRRENVIKSSGLELRMDMTIGYRVKITPAVGIAHGFDEGGETNVYMTVYMDF